MIKQNLQRSFRSTYTNQFLLSALVFAGFFMVSSAFAQNLKVTDLKTEYQVNPLGIDASAPRLSWKLISSLRNVLQTSYQIRVGMDSLSLMRGKDLSWNSKAQKSNSSVFVPYQGRALEPGTKYFWQVKVKDNQGNDSGWSSVYSWRMGLLKTIDWQAKWVTSSLADTVAGRSPVLRKVFTSHGGIKAATAFISAHGVFEARLNGKRIGNDYLSPGWTSYRKRLLYHAYDVTSLVTAGQNAIGFTLGDGWYRGFIGFDGQQNYYGNHLSGLLQLEIEFKDGTKQVVRTDGSWKYSYGPILSSDLYNGEIYDARLEKTGWSTATYNDGLWKAVHVLEAGPESLVSSISPPARKHEVFNAVKLIKTPKGETVIDFGQNLVGWVQFSLKGKAGSKIMLQHGEVLDKDGNFYNDNLRHAKQQITYTFKGDGLESYEPNFTYQGFRYVKVTGSITPLTLNAFKAVSVYSDMDETGTFSTSNPSLNQLQHNIQWGQKGNFLDVPTDCPQRDERLGWTGDAQVFFKTAAFNMNVAGFFTKWMKDVAADQHPNGSVPFVIPDVLGEQSSGSTGWSDVATIIPWNMYLCYGDKDLLLHQYPSMKAWVDYMSSQSKNYLWNTGFHFGDWLFYRPQDDNDGRSAVTDKYLIAQCFYAHSTQLLINAAQVLGNIEDERKYTELLENVKKVFLKEYLTPNGRLVSGTQTAYVLALNFDMLPENLRPQAVEYLVANIRSYDNHLTTGFLGTPYLCLVLSRFGRTDVAYDLLLQDTYPSWLYPVKMGATTIWERWDGIKQDGTFQTTGMNSFNHYSYGAIGDWMYRILGGLNTDDTGPGYKKIMIAPQPGGKISHASTQLETLYGLTGSTWKIENGTFKLDVIVPPNTSATVRLPGAAEAKVTETGVALSDVKEINNLKTINQDLEFKVGSGRYHFEFARTL
jgi:alpha-L-rhamnosidase